MSLYLPREREKGLQQRYEGYRQRCAAEGIAPLPFRSWATIDAEYDIAWAEAQMEYDAASLKPSEKKKSSGR